MKSQREFSDIAAKLRETFDRGFGDAPAELAEAPLAFLQIRVAGLTYLLDLSEISGLDAGNPISPFPSAARAFLGLSGIRGQLIPVFSLARLLGLNADGPTPHWIIQCGHHEPTGFAFDALDAHLSIGRSDVIPVEEGHGSRHVRANALASGVRHPILSLGALVEDIRSDGAVVVSDERGFK